MIRPSFTDWLLEQTDRQDAVGELALNYAFDADVAPRAITAEELLQRLQEIDADPSYHAALQLAAEEYQAHTPG